MNRIFCNECKKNCYVKDGYLVAFQRCAECHYWHVAYLMKENQHMIRINGVQYYIGEESAKDKGFRGQRFQFRYLDKLTYLPDSARPILISTNLNYCGEVPAHFKDRLPDNAEFIK